MKDFTIDDVIEDMFETFKILPKIMHEIPAEAFSVVEVEKMFHYVFGKSLRDTLNRIMDYDMTREQTEILGMEIVVSIIVTASEIVKKALNG